MNFEISRIIKGVIAGFVATVVMTVLLQAKNMMGIMPELDQ